MANLDDLDDDFILCNICNNEYDEEHRAPKLLPCLHTLCNDCTLNSVQGTILKCAICQEEQQISSDLQFLRDSTMRNMMDMIKIQRKSSSILCSDCPDGNIGNAFCKDCYVFLCKECTSAHKRTQITRRHSVLTIDELKTAGIGNFSRKEMCQIPGHEDQPFSFYCESEDCQKPICTQCVVSDHSQSNGHIIKNLAEVYEENKHLVERMIGELLTKISGVSSDAKVLETESTNTEEKHNEIKSEIDALFDSLEELLRQRRSKLKQRVDVICQQRKTEIQEQLDRLQKCKVEMENSCNYSSRMLVFTNKPEFLQLKATVLSKLNQLVGSENDSKLPEDIELSFDAGVDQNRFGDFLNDIGQVQTNIFGDGESKKSPNETQMNGLANMNGHYVMPYKGPPIHPPGKYTTNKQYPLVKPLKLNTSAAKVEPLRLDGLNNDSPTKVTTVDLKQTNTGTKMSPTNDNLLGRPLSLKSPVISPSKQPSSLGDFLNELQKNRIFLKERDESQESPDKEPERQLPKTPTTTQATITALTKRSPVTSPYTPVYPTQSPKYAPASPKYGTSPVSPGPQGIMNSRNGSVTSPGTQASPSYVQNFAKPKSTRTVTFGSPRFKELQSKTDTDDVDAIIDNRQTKKNGDNSIEITVLESPSSDGSPNLSETQIKPSFASAVSSLKGSSNPGVSGTKAHAPALSESSYPEVKQSTTSPRKANTDKPVVFGDISCPDFQLDPNSSHHEREVTSDGRMLRNKKSDPFSSTGSFDIENSLVQYKGAIGTIPFQEAGKFYYEVDVVYNIQQPLEETWLVFEIGLCRLDDVDMHHTVERHEHARSFYVARYPENDKLTQEFWHNRDLLNFFPLSDNTAGIEMRITYGFLVDTKRKKWVVADCNNNKVLHTFDAIDFAEALYPVFGCYNPDLCTVEMTLKTGTEITMIPQCMKSGFRSP